MGNYEAWEKEKFAETVSWAMFCPDISSILDFTKEDQGLNVSKSPLIKNGFGLKMPHVSGRFIKIGLFVFIIFSPILLILLTAIVSGYQMYEVYKSFQSGNILLTMERYEEFKKTAIVQHNVWVATMPISSNMSFIPLVNFWNRYVKLTDSASFLGGKAINLMDDLVEYKNITGSVNGKMTNAFFDKTNEDIKGAQKGVDGLIEGINSFPAALPNKEINKRKLEETQTELGFIRKTLPIWKELSLVEGKKKYMVLFQNNTELRPTGGFIGSYALVEMGNGKILSYSFHDVYEADGQLKAHVDPPLPIRDVMGQPNWFLRDSNFDPDFSLSAQRAMWFLEKETGENVDGVIGVNLNVATGLIGVLGSVYLPDYREEIDASNFLIKATVNSQKDFFPGSTAKRDFIRSVANAMIYKAVDGKSTDYIKLVSAISDSLERKDILIYMQDKKVQEMIEEAGWGGRVVDVSCVFKNCGADFFMSVDANLGVNKANLYVSRNVSVEKQLGIDGIMKTKAVVSYTNESPSGVFPGGDYKDYTRILLPVDVNIEDILADGKSILSDVVVNLYGNDKKSVEFLVEVLANSKKEIIAKYEMPFGRDVESYQLIVEKQAGDSGGTLNLSFAFPPGYDAKARNFKPRIEGNKFLYTTDTAYDRVFVFDFKK